MIFFKSEISSTTDVVSFQAIENDIVCGSCEMKISGSNAEIFLLEYNSDKPYIVEGLIKSAFNFACTKNCYMGYCKCNNIKGFLDKMSFEFKDGVYFNDIPTILQGNCCKCSHNI